MRDVHSPERGETSPSSLEYVLRRHENEITLLAEPGKPLTRDRLSAIAPHLLEIVDTAEADDIAWPDDETAVRIQSGAHIEAYVDVESVDADRLFMIEVLAGLTDRERGFNNFPAILAMIPRRPGTSGEVAASLGEYNLKNDFYSMRPYLWRAHMLNQEFMETLQEAVTACGGLKGWGEAMVQGALEPEEYPHDAALLRSSRLGYKLLANLMRSDDKQRQWEWLGRDSAEVGLIDDPRDELWA